MKMLHLNIFTHLEIWLISFQIELTALKYDTYLFNNHFISYLGLCIWFIF